MDVEAEQAVGCSSCSLRRYLPVVQRRGGESRGHSRCPAAARASFVGAVMSPSLSTPALFPRATRDRSTESARQAVHDRTAEGLGWHGRPGEGRHHLVSRAARAKEWHRNPALPNRPRQAAREQHQKTTSPHRWRRRRRRRRACTDTAKPRARRARCSSFDGPAIISTGAMHCDGGQQRH